MRSPTSALAVTSIRIEQDKLDRFREIAVANRRTVSDHLRWLIDRELENNPQKEAA